VCLQVARTQTHGRGAEAADDTAWAPSAGFLPAQPSALHADPAMQQSRPSLHSNGPGSLPPQAWRGASSLHGGQQRPAPNTAQHLMRPHGRGGPGMQASQQYSSAGSQLQGPNGAGSSLFPAPHQPLQHSRMRGQVHNPASPASSRQQHAAPAPHSSASSAQQQVLQAKSNAWGTPAGQKQQGSKAAPLSANKSSAPVAQHSGSSDPAALQGSRGHMARECQGQVGQHGSGGHCDMAARDTAAEEHSPPGLPSSAECMRSKFCFLVQAGALSMWLQHDLAEAGSALRRMQVCGCPSVLSSCMKRSRPPPPCSAAGAWGLG
jgi:hypothetical protein